MKYKGIELKEITEPQLFNPPKKMLVWDQDNGCTCVSFVHAIVNRRHTRVITDNADWRHCAEIPLFTESKLVTYRELERWLAEGNGEVLYRGTCLSNWTYSRIQENDSVRETMLVRKWDDTEWHKPTREYLGLEY